MPSNLGSMGFTTVEVRVDTRRLRGDLARARKQLRQLQRDIQFQGLVAAQKRITMTGGAYANMASTVRSRTRGMNDSLRSLRASLLSVHTVMLLLAGAGVFAALRTMIQFSDQSIELRNRIRLVTESTGEFNAVQTELFQISQRTRAPLETTIKLYSRLRQFTDRATTGSGALLNITEAVNKAFRISGATTQEQIGATIQFTQGIGSNRLGGEELRSVLENAPRLAQAIAAGFNEVPELAAQAQKVFGKTFKATSGDLKRLNEAGLLFRENVLKATASQALVLDEEFKRIEITISEAAAVLENQFLKTFLDIAEAEPVAIAIRDLLNDITDILKDPAFKETFAQILDATGFIISQWRIWATLASLLFFGIIGKGAVLAVKAARQQANIAIGNIRRTKTEIALQRKKNDLTKRATLFFQKQQAAQAIAAGIGPGFQAQRSPLDRRGNRIQGAARGTAGVVQVSDIRTRQTRDIRPTGPFVFPGGGTQRSQLLKNAQNFTKAQRSLNLVTGNVTGKMARFQSILVNLGSSALPLAARGVKLLSRALLFLVTNPIGIAITLTAALIAQLTNLFGLLDEAVSSEDAAFEELIRDLRLGKEGALELAKATAKAKKEALATSLALEEQQKLEIEATEKQIKALEELAQAPELGVGIGVEAAAVSPLDELRDKLLKLREAQMLTREESNKLESQLQRLGIRLDERIPQGKPSLDGAGAKSTAADDFIKDLRREAQLAGISSENIQERVEAQFKLQDALKKQKITDAARIKALAIEADQLVLIKQRLIEEAEAREEANEAKKEQLQTTIDTIKATQDEARALAAEIAAFNRGGKSELELQRKINEVKAEDLALTDDQIEAEARRRIALDKSAEALENAAEASNLTKEAFEELGGSFASALEDAIVEFERLQEIFDAFLEDITRITVRKLAIEPVVGNLTQVLGDEKSGTDALKDLFPSIFGKRTVPGIAGGQFEVPSGPPGSGTPFGGTDQIVKDLQANLEALSNTTNEVDAAKLQEIISTQAAELTQDTTTSSLVEMTVALNAAKIAVDQFAASAAAAAGGETSALSAAALASAFGGGSSGTSGSVVGSTGGTPIISTPSGSRPLPGATLGGQIFGPGNARSDSILARLSTGEFVVNAEATKNNLGLLRAINENKFANGGMVGGPLPSAANAGGVSNNSNINIMIDGAADPMETAAMVANVLQQRGMGTQRPSRQQRRAATRQLTVARRQGV